MKQSLPALLLIAALILPVALFLWLWQGLHAGLGLAASAGVGVGWGLNVAWAFASRRREADLRLAEQQNTLGIAARFGWVCPAVLVLLAWVAWRLQSAL